MPVIVSPQPTHNTVCSRFLLLIFPLMQYLLGCKLLGCVCFAISVQLHSWKCSSQIASKDLYYKCHGAVPLISLGMFSKLIQSNNFPKDSLHTKVNRLKVLEQTATHARFCSLTPLAIIHCKDP